LTDPLPARRAAAAEALCRAGAPGHIEAARPLLEDPDPRVRLRAGLALARRKHRPAFPVLIQLFDQLPAAETGAVEELLYRLADDRAPAAPPGEAARGGMAKVWAAWWRDHGAAVELDRLDEARRLLGYTLVVQMQNGRVQELDADGKLRW